MTAARIVAPLALLAAAALLSGCQNKGATAVVPVVMAPYAAPAVTISPAPAQSGARAGAVQATPVAATAMNPAAAQYSSQHGPRPTTTPIAAYNIANMPVAATPVITVPTMMAPAPVAATPVAAAPAAAPAYMTAPATMAPSVMATPVMMMAPAPAGQPMMAQPGGGQVMYMMMAPAPAAQPVMAQPVAAQQPPAAAPPPQLMTLPTYGAPVYVMPQAR